MKRILLCLGLISVMIALAIWRVASEPVPLNFLTPYVEEALSRNRQGWQLSVEDTVLSWRGWKKPIDLNLRNVEVHDRKGARIVTLPVVSVGISIRALLQRQIGIRSLEVLQADLVIERNQAGQVGLRSAKDSNQDSDPFELSFAFVAGLLSPEDAAQPISFLEVVRVEADRIVWKDAQRGIELSIADARLDARRVEAGVQCDAMLRLQTNGRPGPKVTVAAEARRKDGAGPRKPDADVGGLDFTASIKVRAEGVPVDDLGVYWPKNLATTARSWVTENISAGEVDEAVLDLTVDRSRGESGKVALGGTLAYHDLTVRYLSDWPEAASVTGSGTFDRRGLHFDVASGIVGSLQVGPSTVEITGLDSDNERLRVQAPIHGPSNEIASLIASRNEDLAKHLALDRSAPVDQGRVDLDIALPLEKEVKVSDVNIVAHGDLPGLKSHHPYAKGVIPAKVTLETSEGGQATVALDLDLTDARLAIPTLRWGKNPGVQGTAQGVLDLDSFRLIGARNLTIDAGTLQTRGSVRLGEEQGRQLQSLELDALSLGETRLSKLVIKDSTAGLHIEIGDGAVDAAAFLSAPWNDAGEGAGRGGADGWLLVAPRLRRVEFENGAALEDVSLRLRYDGRRWQEIDASGTTAGDGSGRFEITLKPTGNGPGRLTARVDDLGSLLRTLGLATELRGGRLRADGETGADGGAPLRAHVEMYDYEFLRSSLLTRLLTFASMRGFGKPATKDSIAFDYLNGDLTFANGRATTDLIRTHGPALGLSITGWVGIDEDKMKLDGAIVPAYEANRVLGKIPVLGSLLSGDGKEGFWAIRYQMSGTRKDPKMEVHTITSLTPALLRNIFGKLENHEPGR